MRFQENGENPKKMTLERATTPKMSSPCNSTTNSMAISVYKRSKSHSKGIIAPWCDSSGGCPVSNMRSLTAVLPKSPSPICSDCSSPRDSTTCSTLSQTPNSQVPTLCPARNLSSCIVSFDSPTTSCKDIDGWMENAKSCCWVRQPYLLNNHFKAIDQELSSLTLPSTEELSYQAYADSMHGAFGARSQNDGQHKLQSHPKPHHALLDEVKKRELEADIDAWKKARFLELVDELERKEAAISIWEFEKAKKAMEEMEKLESKLERKRLREIEKTQKKIGRVNKEANKKKSKARRYTIEEISAVSAFTEKIRATKSSLLHTLRKFVSSHSNT
ncbi:hypothetical protein F2P56_010575 [Juglans regia]|uniref:Remorin C-terminal domain-containing protein n=2 Tax=Juglans regia TaxID=51240 RepID=A0A833XQR1_JUGRE|nr:uncharacterized protein LOC108990549 [Juglans regia]KAF5470023.1 hypothetical protein F2P56_010575 [Juglans regia]